MPSYAPEIDVNCCWWKIFNLAHHELLKVYPTREDAHERLLDGIAELGRATNGGEDSNHGITEKGVQIIMQRGIQK